MKLKRKFRCKRRRKCSADGCERKSDCVGIYNEARKNCSTENRFGVKYAKGKNYEKEKFSFGNRRRNWRGMACKDA